MIKKAIILVLVAVFALSIRIVAFGQTEGEDRAERLARERAMARTKLRLEEMGKITAEEHYRQGKKHYKRRELPQAREEFEKTLELNPGHKGAGRYLKKTEDKLRKLAKEEREGEGGWKEKGEEKEKAKEQVKEYLMRGTEYYNEGRFEEAIEEWKEILPLTVPSHPYHQRARVLISKAWQEKLNREREEVRKKKELEERDRLLEVEKAWLVPRRGKMEEVEEREEVSEARRLITEKARQLVSLNFEETHLREVLRYLLEVGGISIILDEDVFPAGGEIEPEGISPLVTIRLKDIPLLEALDVILRVKGLNYRLEENAIWVTTPENFEREEFITRIFQFASGPGGIEEVLKDSVPWPEGSAINLNRRTGALIITNSPVNMELIEDIIRSLDTTPIQVSIEARIIEIYADSLQDLGIEWEEIGSNFGIDNTDISTVFSPHSRRWVGDLDDYSGEGLTLWYDRMKNQDQFSILLRAIEKTGKSNLLSSPTVTVLNNQEAKIRIVQPLTYPENYAPEQETVDVVVGGQQISVRRDSVRASNFVSRDLGVTLTVTPSVGMDRKVITLNIEPQTIELIGWNEFVDVRVAGGPYWYVVMPVFFTRTIQSRMMVGDGETVVLGGLIMEEQVKDETKVPLLGDIPLLGKLFRRDTTTSHKRNLLIFITTRILTPAGEEFRG